MKSIRQYLILMERDCQCEHNHHENNPCENKAEWKVTTTHGTFRMCTECKTLWEDSPYRILTTQMQPI